MARKAARKKAAPKNAAPRKAGKLKVGFVGLGEMGGQMARNVVEKSDGRFDVFGFDLRKAAMNAESAASTLDADQVRSSER